ncbi:MAG: FAD-dependent oxidoreductase [Desulfarculaceae bacterium]|nr:FAD-dependent oxidoreductase [Desulfarculaceae bacterium]MCF8071720.1 FAD-dependent oxidoreductase [Desulfarculaceae bacterium]MCF8102433.1 FAD-dependent oxidoreductase [Desulfarculaceae bacterium]
MNQNGSKDPAPGVLVVGSGYGALKAAEDLSHAGIPVIWATRSSQFLDLPEGVEPFEDWPGDLNFQFRPLYLRVTRHPLVTPLTQTRLESLSLEDGSCAAHLRQDPVYVDYDLCTGCSRCMELCPLNHGEHPPLQRSPAFCPSRALLLDKRPVSPCRQACPLGVNAQAYLALTAAGSYDKALAVVRRDNPLPGVCGYICSHPCESACRRGELDEPLAIRDIKRFLFDHEAELGPAALPEPEMGPRGQKVAVVGSGPAGLSAAHFLNQQGFAVTILEAAAQAGGMLRRGINAFRLPRPVLEAEVEALEQSGVEIITGTKVESARHLLDQGFDAVLLTVGTQRDLRLNLPGEELDGVLHCLDFLSAVNLGEGGSVGQRTVVIGGGNSAMDAARTAVRLGARQVTVVAIETEYELPASPREVAEAAEEGVAFQLGYAPVGLSGEGAIAEVSLRRAHWERPEDGPPRIEFDSEDIESIEADTVIVAISQSTDLPGSPLGDEVKLGGGGRLAVNEDLATSLDGVFAAGDAVSGPSTVVQAMAAGRRAAARVHGYLTGEASPWRELDQDPHGVGEHLPISEDLLREPRQRMAQRQPKVRRRDFEAVDLGLTVSQAQAEAERCLQCASCCECLECEAACEQVGAIDHSRQGRALQVRAPAVVWAEAGAPPWQGQAAPERVFPIDPESYSADLMDVLMMGSAAAGLAMAPAAGLRVPAVPAEAPPRPRPATGRIGFFLCACNGSMAPAPALERILDLARPVPGVAHVDSVFSVCHPQGADQIAEAVDRHQLSQIILASCVCCPLNFQCISCNDQRTRARMHLFERLGLDRGMVETVNLRDHLHAGQFSQEQIVQRARAMLRPAFIRMRHPGALRMGDTEIKKRVLVLGGSQVGISAARNLALQGLSVRLVHRAWPSGQELPDSIAARPLDDSLEDNITAVEAAEIEAIRGVLGDFKVKAKLDGRWRTWSADVVCLTDENLIGLSLYAGQTGLKKFYRYDFSFFNTPHSGVYRIMPVTLERVDPWQAGAALAGEVATTAAKAYLLDHQLSPVVDPARCRGCGRCAEICPFEAITLKQNPDGSFTSQVFRHNCVGCGGCVGRCPVSALDIPYFSNQLLEQMVAGVMGSEV